MLGIQIHEPCYFMLKLHQSLASTVLHIVLHSNQQRHLMKTSITVVACIPKQGRGFKRDLLCALELLLNYYYCYYYYYYWIVLDNS